MYKLVFRIHPVSLTLWQLGPAVSVNPSISHRVAKLRRNTGNKVGVNTVFLKRTLLELVLIRAGD